MRIGLKTTKLYLAWVGLWAMCVPGANSQTTYTETVLHNFDYTDAPHGYGPSTALLRDSAGNLYGGTGSGGSWGDGVIFQLDPSGQQTVIHSMSGPPQGIGPTGTLARDESGNIYGATVEGGSDVYPCSSGCGVLFMIDSSGNETVLHTFTDGDDGGLPYSGVVRDAAGNLYGTTADGGKGGGGVVFKFDAAGNETVLHDFGGGADGSGPDTGVTIQNGYLYGTTECGGTGTSAYCTGGAGVIFRLDATGHETILYNFTGGADGGYPQSGVTLDQAGNLYGSTYAGNGNNGAVYKLSPAGQLTVLHAFTDGADGVFPSGNLYLDSSGNLYGTAQRGGTGNGTIFRVDAAGNFAVLHRFAGVPDGSGPLTGVIPCGPNLCGTTYRGGTSNAGTVFQIDGSGTFTILYSFPAKADGTDPLAGLVMDSTGNLYGTTSTGGASDYGILFKVDSTGKYSILYDLSSESGDLSEAPLTVDSLGNLYGTAYSAGSLFYGTVFKYSAAGQFSVLYNFTGGDDGAHPQAGVTFDSAGNLYGTTVGGGQNGDGTVYKLSPTGQLTVLHAFAGGPGGAGPTASVIFDSAGNLYGTTKQGGNVGCYPRHGCGVVYKIDHSGQYTVLYSFTGDADGGGPYANVIVDSAGNLYGTTYQGGAYGYGVIYKIDPAGNESVLYAFTGGSDGGDPLGGLLRDSTGNLYGTASSGGTLAGSNGPGVVFELDAQGNYSVLHSFTGPPDGSTPYGTLVMDSAGNLYGTTEKGGKLTTGTIFKLSPQ